MTAASRAVAASPARRALYGANGPDKSRYFQSLVLHPPKDQIARCPPFALGLGFVARGGETVPGQPPVVGALGGPLEVARARDVPQRPGRVVGPIAGEAEFPARPQHARDRGERAILHEAPLPMAALRPRIGID